jgi:hypothetical protein
LSIPLIINGQTFQYPETGDPSWGLAATSWAAAVTSGMLQKAGGAFTLLAEVDFGATYGLKSTYFKSRTSTPATAGQFRLAKTDVVSWRNNAGDGNLDLSINGSDALLFNGVALGNFVSVSDTSTINLTLAAGVLSADIIAGSITNSMVNASAAIALTKLAATTASRAIVSDGSGFLVPATTTATEIGYVNGVTSSIQTQLDGKQATGNYITALTGNVTASGPGSAVATIANGVITNAMINASAAIAVSKLAALTASRAVVTDSSGFLAPATTTATEIGYVNGVTSAIQTQLDGKQATGNYITALTGNVTASGPGSAAATIANDVITNAMINSAAAIAFSKLASLTSAHILVGSAGNVATDTAVTGDITISNAGVTAIGTNKVTNAMLAQMAAHTFKGNNTGSTANAADLTATQLTAELNVMTGDSGSGGLKGLVPAQATGDATKFLNGAGAWSNPSGSGDVVGPASAGNNKVVLFDGTTGKLIKDSGLTLAGTNTGDVTLANSTNGLTISSQVLTMALAASGASGTVSATTQTFTGIKTFETQLIGKGTATNDNAASGYIGETIEATESTGVSISTILTVKSITLTAGDWLIWGTAGWATGTTGGAGFGISGTTNSLTGLVYGVDKYRLNASAGVDISSSTTGVYRKSISGTTTYYLVVEMDGATVTVKGRILAVRIR